MPEVTTDPANSEVAILTRAVENLFRRLIRFLVGRISLVKLQEIIRYIFVEEIENKLKKENPKKNVSLSQLAILSGLDTRTLTKIRNSERYRQPFHTETSFLREFVPGASILDEWTSKAPYVDGLSGEPKELNISGDPPSFESLYLDSAQSRGVTYRSLLERLAESGAISIDEKRNKVLVKKKAYMPSDSKDRLGAIEVGFSALSNLADTVTANILALDKNEERLFQRGVWTYRLQLRDKECLRSELNKLLEKTDQQARIIIEKYIDKNSNSEQLTAGVSYFYFEESTN